MQAEMPPISNGPAQRGRVNDPDTDGDYEDDAGSSMPGSDRNTDSQREEEKESMRDFADRNHSGLDQEHAEFYHQPGESEIASSQDTPSEKQPTSELTHER